MLYCINTKCIFFWRTPRGVRPHTLAPPPPKSATGRTHVDTVQTVLHGLINWRHICWSHTMKVFGSCVAFVRRNSSTVASSRYMFSDMKLWSHMFAVNVQSVSIQQVNWDVIIQYIQNANSFPVVYVINCSKVKRTLRDTSRNVQLNMM